MAETPTNLSAVPPEKASGGKLWKILTIVLFLAVVGLGAMMFMSKSNAPAAEGATEKAAIHKKGAEKAKRAVKGDVQAILEVKPIVVNLADVESSRYIRIGVNLGVNDKKLTDEFENDPLLKSEINDTIINVLSSKTSTELLSPKGKEKLKEDLKKALNETLEDEPVEKVFFTDFIVQL